MVFSMAILILILCVAGGYGRIVREADGKMSYTPGMGGWWLIGGFVLLVNVVLFIWWIGGFFNSCNDGFIMSNLKK